MLKIHALPDGQEASITCLGTLHPLPDAPSRPLKLIKRITVAELGRYKKTLTTPLYGKQAMLQAALGASDWSFGPTHCKGILCRGLKAKVEGFVRRVCGGHTFCLPVYSQEAVSPVFYAITGYLPVENGFVAVAKRRTLLWSLLGLLAGITFVLSYLLFRYGAQGAMAELARVYQELLGLLP